LHDVRYARVALLLSHIFGRLDRRELRHFELGDRRRRVAQELELVRDDPVDEIAAPVEIEAHGTTTWRPCHQSQFYH
jgi:hypothetical protein